MLQLLTDAAPIFSLLGMLAAVLAVVFGWPQFRAWLYPRWPKLTFTNRPFSKHEVRGRTFLKSATLEAKEAPATLVAIVAPRTALNVRRIDVRFVEGRFRRFRRDAYDGQIAVCEVTIPDAKNVTYEAMPDGVYLIHFDPPRSWAADQQLYLHIGVHAQSPWNGLLSVELMDEVRARVRRKVHVRRKEGRDV